MTTDRLEAFSDGVIAILITIMVLELHVPEDDTFEALRPLFPTLASYVLSFVFIGIYWNNHHHLFQASGRVNGPVLWANLHLLFWLSLFPFTTGWMGENHFASMPTALYGGVLLMAAIAYRVLQQSIIAAEGPASVLESAIALRDLAKRVDLRFRRVAGGEGRGGALQHLAHRVELRDHAVIQFGDDHAAPRVTPDEALALQPAQGLPDGRAARTQPRGELQLAQTRARLQRAALDGLEEPLVGEVAARGLRLAGLGRPAGGGSAGRGGGSGHGATR